jgi:hypothetical protein
MLLIGKQGREFCFLIADSARKREPREIQCIKSGDLVVFGGSFLLLGLDDLHRVGYTCIETVVHLGQGLARILPVRLCEFDLTQCGAELNEGVAHILLHFGLLIFILGLPLTQGGASLLNVHTDFPPSKTGMLNVPDATKTPWESVALGSIAP